MRILREFLLAWGPAFLMMALIFVISSQPSTSIPNFRSFDAVVKKGGHMVGYGLLSLLYWRGLGLRSGRPPVAWLLTIAYALTDEFHQAFVPGRHAALMDVALFDNLGAVLSLLAYSKIKEKI